MGTHGDTGTYRYIIRPLEESMAWKEPEWNHRGFEETDLRGAIEWLRGSLWTVQRIEDEKNWCVCSKCGHKNIVLFHKKNNEKDKYCFYCFVGKAFGGVLNG